jgi:hypothetical protein
MKKYTEVIRFCQKNCEITINRQKVPASHKIITCLLKLFCLLSSLTYSHNWLIPLGHEHHHRGYITNLEEEKQTDTLHNNKQSF